MAIDFCQPVAGKILPGQITDSAQTVAYAEEIEASIASARYISKAPQDITILGVQVQVQIFAITIRYSLTSHRRFTFLGQQDYVRDSMCATPLIVILETRPRILFLCSQQYSQGNR